MLTLAEQQKLPWCNGCDFRATGTWKWCEPQCKLCDGRKAPPASDQATDL